MKKNLLNFNTKIDIFRNCLSNNINLYSNAILARTTKIPSKLHNVPDVRFSPNFIKYVLKLPLHICGHIF